MNNEGIMEEITNYDTEKQVEKDIKSNEDVMKKKIHNILEDLNDIDKLEKKKEIKKKLVWSIILIVEIVVIILIIKSR